MSWLDDLDRGLEQARTRPGWCAGAILGALPGRLALADLAWTIALLPAGATVGAHADALRSRAWWWLGLWACGLVVRHAALQALRSGRWRLEPRWLAVQAGIASLLLVLALATLPTLLVPAITVVLAGALWSAPSGRLTAGLGGALALQGLVFLVGWVLATFTLVLAAGLIAWLAAPLLDPAQAARWAVIAGSGNPLLWLLGAAVGAAVIEPLWLASLAAYADRRLARSTGEDLAERLARLERVT